MIGGYATSSRRGVPYAVLGEGVPSILIVPGIEPEHRVPDGLRLQGVHSAFEELAEQGTIAVAWRADGSGADGSGADGSGADAYPGIADIADDYVDLIRELEMVDVTVVGISAGAPMAIETAARLGHRCSRLALVSGGAYLSPEGRALLQRAIGYAERGTWRRLAREQIAAFYPGVFGRTVLAGVAWLFPGLYGEPEDPAHFIGLTKSVLEADLRERSEQVTARALVITGERDILYPPDIARETALLFADGASVSIPGAGHGVFKSHAGRITRLLANHIAGGK